MLWKALITLTTLRKTLSFQHFVVQRQKAQEVIRISNVIHFDEFKDALENGKVVDNQNLKSTSELNHQFDYWKSRITGGRAVTETDHQVLDIIKQAYNLGMVTKDNMLLRNQAINAYKTSI